MNARPSNLRILLSAFACDPHEGSEPGVGWDWAFHLAKAGHDVTILARDYHRPSLEAGIQAAGLPNLRCVCVGVRLIPFWMPLVDVYPYYMLWQWKAFLRARQLHRSRPFDVVHHLTYSAFRSVSYMHLLGVPFIFGPVGGGESAPLALRRSMSPRSRLSETVRDLANLLPRLNPVWRSMVNQAACVVAKTEATRDAFPRKVRPRVILNMENMITSVPSLAGDLPRATPLRLLYAGRLLSWKGVHLAIRAIARVAADNLAHLTIVGNGREEAALKQQARQLGVDNRISFISWLPRAEVLALHASHDALLFPSLHDSGGTVVMEAMSLGKPVICLDLGGPAVAVDRHCARIVQTRNRSEEQVVEGLAEAIRNLAAISDAEWETMRQAALDRAYYHAPQATIARIYNRFLAPVQAAPSA